MNLLETLFLSHNSQSEPLSKMKNRFGIVLRRTKRPKISEDIFHLLVDSIKDYATFMIDSTGHIIT